MLEIRNVTRRFGKKTAVNAVDLAIPQGQMVGIIGRSGAGKSTLLRMINRLIDPSDGSILFDGSEVSALRGATLRRWQRDCAMIFQQFNLVPRLDVLTNVLLGRLNHRSTVLNLAGVFSRAERAHAIAALERLDIAGTALQRAGTLSGGQQQRVALARALAKNAPLMLLDEPLVNLDYKLREELRDELSALFAAGSSTVVYATTEPTEALLLGGYTAVMDAGELLQYGPTAEVFHRPASIRVARAFSDPPMNLIAGGAQALQPHLADSLGGLLAMASPDTTLGVRAGALRVQQRPGDIVLPGTVDLAEISGSDTFVHADTPAGELVVQLTGVHYFELGARITLYLDPQQVYVFAADGALKRAPAIERLMAGGN